MNKHRVVITGLGAITALAESVEGLFTALCQGKSGISPIESFDVTEFPVRFGGEIKDFDVTKYIEVREAKRMDRFTQFSVAAASQAVKDSGLDFSKEDLWRVGSIIGTGIGGIHELNNNTSGFLPRARTRYHRFVCRGLWQMRPAAISQFATA